MLLQFKLCTTSFNIATRCVQYNFSRFFRFVSCEIRTDKFYSVEAVNRNCESNKEKLASNKSKLLHFFCKKHTGQKNRIICTWPISIGLLFICVCVFFRLLWDYSVDSNFKKWPFRGVELAGKNKNHYNFSLNLKECCLVCMKNFLISKFYLIFLRNT